MVTSSLLVVLVPYIWIGLEEERLCIIPCFLMVQRTFGSITVWTQLWWSHLPSERGFQIVRIKITHPKGITQFLLSQVGRLAGKFTHTNQCVLPLFKNFSC